MVPASPWKVFLTVSSGFLSACRAVDPGGQVCGSLKCGVNQAIVPAQPQSWPSVFGAAGVSFLHREETVAPSPWLGSHLLASRGKGASSARVGRCRPRKFTAELDSIKHQMISESPSTVLRRLSPSRRAFTEPTCWDLPQPMVEMWGARPSSRTATSGSKP